MQTFILAETSFGFDPSVALWWLLPIPLIAPLVLFYLSWRDHHRADRYAPPDDPVERSSCPPAGVVRRPAPTPPASAALNPSAPATVSGGDDDFTTSLVVGMASGSALLGAAVGGSIAGGFAGAALGDALTGAGADGGTCDADSAAPSTDSGACDPSSFDSGSLDSGSSSDW